MRSPEPKPISTEGCAWPFPLDTLPSDISGPVRAVAAAMETDPAGAASVALGVLSAVTAGRLRVRVHEGWSEPCNLYIVTVLPSGDGKSPTFSKMTAPVRKLERELIEEAKPLAAERSAERDVLEERIKTAKRKASKADGIEETETAIAELADLTARLDALPPIAHPRLLANDATPEALAKLAAENNGTIAVVSPETPLFGTVGGTRYSGAPNFEFLLSAHSGEGFTVDRINRPAEHIEAAHLTLCLAIQPIVIQEAKRVRELEERGLLARMLFVWPVSRVGYRSRKLVSLPPAELERWERLVRGLFAELRAEQREVPLTDAARQRFEQWRGTIEAERRAGGKLEHFAAWGGKLDSQVLRLAALLAVCRGEHEVGCERLEQAIQLGAYFLANVRALYRDLALSDFERKVQSLKRRIAEQRWEHCSKRDLQRAARVDADACRRLIRRLEEEHWIARQERTSHGGGPGRKPSDAYRINPRVHELYGRDTNDRRHSVESVTRNEGK